MRKVYAFVRYCGRNNQCHAAIFQLKNKEVLLELSLGLKYCYAVAYIICSIYYSTNFEVSTYIIFTVAKIEKVKVNDQILHKRLNNMI